MNAIKMVPVKLTPEELEWLQATLKSAEGIGNTAGRRYKRAGGVSRSGFLRALVGQAMKDRPLVLRALGLRDAPPIMTPCRKCETCRGPVGSDGRAVTPPELTASEEAKKLRSAVTLLSSYKNPKDPGHSAARLIEEVQGSRLRRGRAREK